jgi:hypothetical protein
VPKQRRPYKKHVSKTRLFSGSRLEAQNFCEESLARDQDSSVLGTSQPAAWSNSGQCSGGDVSGVILGTVAARRLTL